MLINLEQKEAKDSKQWFEEGETQARVEEATHNSLLKLTWRDDSEQRSSSSEFNVRRAGYEVNNMDDRKASDDLVLHYCSCAHLSTLAHARSRAICLIYLASSSSFTIGTFQNVWDGGEEKTWRQERNEKNHKWSKENGLRIRETHNSRVEEKWRRRTKNEPKNTVSSVH